MTDYNPEQFDDLVDRLLENRTHLEPVDLDRIKLQVLGRGASYSFAGSNRSRLIAPILAVGLMGGGTAASLAGGGGTSQPPSSCGQYKTNGKPKSCKPPKSAKTAKKTVTHH